MGRKGGGGEAGKRGSFETTSHHTIRETAVSSAFPRFEIPGWRDRLGVEAGITGRGTESGRGFDLGLWSKEPVAQVMSRWLAFRRSFSGFHAVVLGNQVHGVEIMSISSGQGWIQVEGIDGWITTGPGILLTVTVADCVPVYLVAPQRGVALLHAGWRGTAAGILERGIERLQSETKVARTDIIMHCGVGICGSCYEVGSEVLKGCGVPHQGTGPWHIDLRQKLRGDAARLGLISVTSSAWCSAHDRSEFYSHRASGGTDGRMVAYIGIPGVLASNLIPE